MSNCAMTKGISYVIEEDAHSVVHQPNLQGSHTPSQKGKKSSGIEVDHLALRKEKRIKFNSWTVSVVPGDIPYPGISNKQLYRLLKAGYRMDKPDMCSDEM